MGSSIRPDKKPGSSTGAGCGGGTGATAGWAGADTTSLAAAAGSLAATAAGSAASAELAVSATAGAAASAPVATGAATPGTAKPGAGVLVTAAAGAGAVPAGAEAVLSLLSSLMFLESSSTRAEASVACLRWASCSSVDFWPWMAPLDSVSLSGAVLAARWSSTWVCTLPAAARLEAATSAAGAAPASLRRNSLKSRLWAARIWRASPDGVALASAAEGNCRTAPALTRLTLP